MKFHNIFEESRKKEKPKPKIIVDYREKNALVFSELIALGCEVEFKQLNIGDYVVGETIIERKTIPDFASSIFNKRLLKQIESIKQKQSKMIILEGFEEYELYNHESGNAVRGMILSIALKHKIPLIFTKNSQDTAKFIAVLSKKQVQNQETGLNDKPKPRDINEQMQYIIEGFPGIGPKNAKKLLEKFKTIKNILNQTEEEIEKIIGKKSIAFKILNQEYKSQSQID